MATGWLITQRSQVRMLSPLLCPRYQRKWPPETSPGAVFMPDGNVFGNAAQLVRGIIDDEQAHTAHDIAADAPDRDQLPDQVRSLLKVPGERVHGGEPTTHLVQHRAARRRLTRLSGPGLLRGFALVDRARRYAGCLRKRAPLLGGRPRLAATGSRGMCAKNRRNGGPAWRERTRDMTLTASPVVIWPHASKCLRAGAIHRVERLRRSRGSAATAHLSGYPHPGHRRADRGGVSSTTSSVREVHYGESVN